MPPLCRKSVLIKLVLLTISFHQRTLRQLDVKVTETGDMNIYKLLILRALYTYKNRKYFNTYACKYNFELITERYDKCNDFQ